MFIIINYNINEKILGSHNHHLGQPRYTNYNDITCELGVQTNMFADFNFP
jgi:hypothetical protein